MRNPLCLALVAEWYTQQVEGLCREAWWFESTRGHRLIEWVSKLSNVRIPTFYRSQTYIRGRLAQLVRAAALHAVGQGFESLVAHSCYHSPPNTFAARRAISSPETSRMCCASPQRYPNGSLI